MELQRASLPLKRAAFGDLSPEVAGTLQLIGGVEMTQGQVRQAHRSMRKVKHGGGQTCSTVDHSFSHLNITPPPDNELN